MGVLDRKLSEETWLKFTKKLSENFNVEHKHTSNLTTNGSETSFVYVGVLVRLETGVGFIQSACLARCILFGLPSGINIINYDPNSSFFILDSWDPSYLEKTTETDKELKMKVQLVMVLCCLVALEVRCPCNSLKSHRNVLLHIWLTFKSVF